MSDERAPSNPPEGRRTFLKAGVGVIGAGLAGVVVAPALQAILWPLSADITSGGEDFVIVGDRSQFGKEPVKVDIYADRTDAWNRTRNVKIGSAWVVDEDGQLTAFSSACPHLGCAVDWAPDEGKFKCPCHRSAFGRDGSHEEGPSPRPLDTLELQQRDQLIAIRFQRFKQGSETKVPA